MTKLYELTEQFHALLQQIEQYTDPEAGSETPTDETLQAALAETLDALGGDIRQKALGTARVIVQLEATAEAQVAAAKRMKARADANYKHADYLRKYVIHHLKGADILDKFADSEVEMGLAKNPPSVDVVDETAVPLFYKVMPPPPLAKSDKRAILQSLQAGTEVPGCRIADLSYRLSIK